MLKIVVDTLGGDNSPFAQVEGAIKAINYNNNIEIVLVGKQIEIENILKSYQYNQDKVIIFPCDEEISANEIPTKAIKKLDSSLMRSIEYLKNNDDAVGLVSSGNTGALMAAGLFSIGRCDGVVRPALASLIPKKNNKYFCLLDCGANVDCKDNFLLQFAVMGRCFVKRSFSLSDPIISLLSIGSEDSKGNELTKYCNKMFKTMPFKYYGNIESRDVFFSNVDVLVCDGFVGNIFLKTTEGCGLFISDILKNEVFTGALGKTGGLIVKNKMKILKDLFDYSNIGGAPMLGLNKLILKSHGSACSKTISAAIEQVEKLAKIDLVKDITQEIAKFNILYKSYKEKNDE